MRNILLFIFLQHYCPQTYAIPRTIDQQTKNSISVHRGSRLTNTVTYKTQYENQVQFLVRIGGKDHVLHLNKAQDLLALNFTASHYREDGKLVTESTGHLAHCCYTGTVDGVTGSSVSVCTCHGLSGYITIGDEIYSIDPIAPPESQEYVITNLRKRHLPSSARNRPRRSLSFSRREDQRQSYNIELFLVADMKEFQRHGEELQRTRHHLISVAHHLNQIFSKINFQVFLVGVEIWTQKNQAVVSDAASTTLQRFLRWRVEDLLPRKHHDNVQLISGDHFKNHALGEAFVAKMCTKSQSGGIIKDTGLSARELAKYVAHEMGHNLGMSHDTENCYCPAARGKCLLSGRTGSNMNDMFSDCSHHSLSRFLQDKDVSCLKDRPDMYIDEPVLQSHPYEVLEIIGKVSIFLCLVVIILTLILIWKTKICKPLMPMFPVFS
ncbi:disintegrin and metalloproteinase domain-containing protein 33 [Mixophyes fleayi]|uniref:disintegrin and metalloproteinase domain-containing protein 33 n=1 Tax=Mixophyes fleayi TaxID=3061075 RepID=UPI003F4E1C17